MGGTKHKKKSKSVSSTKSSSSAKISRGNSIVKKSSSNNNNDEETKQKSIHEEENGKEQVLSTSANSVLLTENFLRERNENLSLVVDSISSNSRSLNSLRENFFFKKGEMNKGTNCWSEPLASTFVVRGPTYLSNGKKQNSQPSVFDLLDVDIFKTSVHGRYDNFSCLEKTSFYNHLRTVVGEERFVLTFHIQSPVYNMVATFVLNEDRFEATSPGFKELFWCFVDGDDKSRCEKFKVIPRLVESHWLLKAACGRIKPILYAKKLTHRFVRKENYFEIMCDTASSQIASKLASMAASTCQQMTFDMAILVEGTTEHRLPEQILGIFQLGKPDLKNCRTVHLPN